MRDQEGRKWILVTVSVLCAKVTALRLVTPLDMIVTTMLCSLLLHFHFALNIKIYCLLSLSIAHFCKYFIKVR